MFDAQVEQYAQDRQCQLCNRIGSPNTVQLEEKRKGPQSDWEKQARLDVDQQAGDAGLFHSVKISTDAAGDPNHQEGKGGDDQRRHGLLGNWSAHTKEGDNLTAQQAYADCGGKRNQNRQRDCLFKEEADMLLLTCAVVKAQQRLNTVAHSLQQQLHRCQHIGQQRKDGKGIVTAVADALPVGQNDDDRWNQRLTKGGDADAQDGL